MVHMIFVYKYRKKLLAKLGGQIRQLMSDIAEEKDSETIGIRADQNHIHYIGKLQSHTICFGYCPSLKANIRLQNMATRRQLPVFEKAFLERENFSE